MSYQSGRAPVVVTGGVGGIVADCDELRALAGRFGSAGADVLVAAGTLHGYAVHPAVLASSALDPVGYATFEADLLDALDGPRGLAVTGARCVLLDAQLRAAAGAYESADHLAGRLRDSAGGLAGLGPALLAGITASRRPGRAGPLDAVLSTDPQLADAVIDALGLPGVIAATATALPDGRGVATPLGLDAGGVAGRPPRRLTDIVRELGRRGADPHHGAVDVRILTMPDGGRRAIVDITGTRSWDPLPTRDVTSLATNGRALVGRPTAYEQGVLAAMRKAGVQRDDPVLIVGHSEGGLVAVTTARDAVRRGEFRVTHVVTAGAPIGLTVGSLPRSVQVLALESTRDLVPHLDGQANPDEPNITTARSARGSGTILGNHGIADAYLPVAADVQAAPDESVRHFLASADGFLRASRVRTHTFQVNRHYP